MPETLQPGDARIQALVNASVAWHRNSGDVDWMWATPALLSERVQTRMEKAASFLSSDDKTHFEQALQIARLMRQRLEQHPDAPLGSGPLEQLQHRLENGELGAAAALKVAGDLGAKGELSEVYLKAIGRLAYSLAVKQQWKDAVRFSMMARTAARAAGPDSELAPVLPNLDVDSIEVAAGALWFVPDARLYADAVSTGEATLKAARAAGDRDFEGRICHALGTLHLDPWFANRSPETYRSEHVVWYKRAEQESWDGAKFVSKRPAPLPDPAVALENAEKYYREAVKLRTGPRRGQSLKALAQTLIWRSQLDDKGRKKEIEQVIDQALADVEPTSNPALFTELLLYLTKVDSTRATDAVESLLQEPPESLIRRIGPNATLNVYFYLADILTTAAPPRALTLVREVAHLFTQLGDESMRTKWWRLQVLAVIAAAAPGAKKSGEPKKKSAASPHPILDEVQAMLDRAKKESWNERQMAAESIRLARRTTASDEEDLAVKLFDSAEKAAPFTLAPFKDAILFQRASFLVNVASNAYHAKDHTGAVAAYAEAIIGYLELKTLTHTGEVLARLADVAGEGGAEGAAAVLTALAPNALTLQVLLGDEGMFGVRRICDRAIAALAAGKFSLVILTGLWQLAKGLQFGAFLTSGSSHRFTPSADELDILEQIATLRAEADAEPEESSVLKRALQDETILLTPYSRSAIQLAGDSATERLTNLELGYEALVDERLRTLAGDAGSQILAPEELREGIDPDTVLLDLLEVTEKSGKSRLLYALWTRETVSFASRPLSDMNPGFIVIDGVTIAPSMLSSMVQSTRGSLRENPPVGDPLSANAAADLAYCGDALLSPIWAELTFLQTTKGKTHLCIVPHGAMHYLPFHLLLVDGKPLGDTWNVSYLPNTRLLLSNRGAQSVKGYRVDTPTAIACDFEGTDDPLLEAVTEAREIAAVSGGKAIVNRQATESAVHSAFKTSRMVHIATHGALPSGAAAFQRLLLSAAGEDDGVLYAHELLGHDYRGLALVTLSACETSLGRFDMGDNLRGLPAYLFLAGTEAVVGTLWPVETTTSSTFFRAMYRELAGGAERLDAFAKAQRETRELHPEYRNWGAFCYSGNWS